MNRSLSLKIATDPKLGGLTLTVKHAESDGDENLTEQHITTTRDDWASEPALAEAAARAIQDYFGRLRADAANNLTPIEKAAKG